MVDRKDRSRKEQNENELFGQQKFSIYNLPATKEGKIKIKVEQQEYKSNAFMKIKQMQTNKRKNDFLQKSITMELSNAYL